MTSDKPFDDKQLAENMIAALSPLADGASGEPSADVAPPAPEPLPHEEGTPLSYGFLSADGLQKYFVPSANAPSEMVIPAPPPGFAPSHEAADDRWAETGVYLPFCEFLAYKAALAYADWPSDGEGGVVKGDSDQHPIKRVLAQSSAEIENFRFFETPEKMRKAEVSDTQGYGFTLDGVIYVIMRGTESDLDWSGNLDADVTLDEPPKDYAFLGNDFHRKFHVEGQHQGFARGWATVRREVVEWIDNLPWPAGAPRQVVFAGHSLGGALAKIGAYEVEKKQSVEHYRGCKVVAVVTFGAPMVGTEAFRADYDDALGGRTLRLESKGDIVPLIMGRWYYRLNRGVSGWLRGLMEGKIDRDNPASAKGRRSAAKANFAKLGQEWTFTRAPIMEWGAIDSILKAAQQDSTSAASASRAEPSSPTDPQPVDASTDAAVDTDSAPKDQAPAEAPAEARTDEAAQKAEKERTRETTEKPKRSPQADPDDDAGGEAIYWVIGVGSLIMLAVAAIYGYQLYKKFTRSHEIQRRYALYLSSLSYARLRELHADDVAGANQALKAHLNFVRGEVPDEKHVFGDVMNLPLRVETPEQLKKIQALLGAENGKHVI